MVPLPRASAGNLTTMLPVGELPSMLKEYNVPSAISTRNPTPTSGTMSSNVNSQQGNTETIARIPEIISIAPVPPMSTSSCSTLVDGNHISRKSPVSQTPQQYPNNRTRLHTTPSASTRTIVSPNSNCSGPSLAGSSHSPEPIRHKSRRHETSPFERKPVAHDGSVGDDGKLFERSYTLLIRFTCYWH